MKSIKENIKNFTLLELKEKFKEIGYDRYRADQVFNWLYNHLINDFNDMQNVSKLLRNKLQDSFKINSLNLLGEKDSKSNETKKYLLETEDSLKIESVFIPEEKRNTLCISTQAGCPLDCKFCATGLMGFKRNLTAAEIIDQYLIAAKEFGKKNITNIVFMGMGEPLINFKNVIKTLRVFTDDLFKGLNKNRITVSTSGIPHKIIELSKTKMNVKLAFSLHSCFEEVRSQIMPVNIKYSLTKNIEALKEYSQSTRTRITFEYTMLAGINDRDQDIKELVRLCSSIPSKINLIPFNSIAHMNPEGLSSKLTPTSSKRIIQFADALRNKNITVMLRDTRGDDISAACGQLAIYS